MTDHAILVLNTCPNSETARRIGTMLVNQGLAACVNILPGITSIYEWKGKIQADAEVLLIIKTMQNRYAELQSAVTELHPYELPELIALPISDGLPPYLQWIADQVNFSTKESLIESSSET